MKYCYLLTRSNRETQVVSPFTDPLQVSSWKEGEPLTVFSGSTATQDQKDEVHKTIFRQIDRGVDRWVQDTRYLPRLFLGGLVFLLTYFIFSLAVRDPIPMLDELLLATGASLLAVNLMSRRDKKSSVALKQRLELKNQASECTFEINEELKCLDDQLYEFSHVDPIDLAEQIALHRITIPCNLEQGVLADFREHLLTWIAHNSKGMNSLLKQFERIGSDEEKQEYFSSKLLKLSMNGTLDLPLFALATTLLK